MSAALYAINRSGSSATCPRAKRIGKPEVGSPARDSPIKRFADGRMAFGQRERSLLPATVESRGHRINTSAHIRWSGPDRQFWIPLGRKLGLSFFQPVILCPAFLLSGSNPLARCGAHGASFSRSSRFGCCSERRFRAQLPLNVSDLFRQLLCLVLITDQCSFQKGVVVCTHRP